MKIVDFKVPQTAKEAFRFQHDELPYFYDRLHHHAEWQLMLILKGQGTLVAGDYVGRFEEGDLYLIASGQTHVFRCDDHYFRGEEKAESLSIYFSADYLGKHFWELQEMSKARGWLDQAQSGLQIKGKTQAAISQRLVGLAGLEGMPRVVQFLEIMNLLIESTDLVPLSTTMISKRTGREGRRINDVLQFTFQESHRKIYLDEVAQIANLSVEAFCRFFKLSTGKTYATFVNDLRVSKACKLLAERELTIQEVCFESGFNNLSNFNRIFKRTTGHPPSLFGQMTGLRRASTR